MCFPHFADVASRAACWILSKRKQFAVIMPSVSAWGCTLGTTLPSDCICCEATFQTAVVLTTENHMLGRKSQECLATIFYLLSQTKYAPSVRTLSLRSRL